MWRGRPGTRRRAGLLVLPIPWVSFVGGAATRVEQGVPGPDKVFEGLGIAAGVGMAAEPGLSAKRPDHLFSVSISRHTEGVMRTAAAGLVEVAAHG